MITDSHRTPWMLVADVDDTLTGDDEALASLMAALREAGTVRLVLDSSRPIASVATTLAGLPVEVAPDAVVGALGTEVVIRGEPRPGWQERFAGFDRAPVDLVMAALGWPLHPPELQTPFKASFAIPPAGRSEAERRVTGTGLAARCLHGDSDYFDVIPANAGKEAPLGYLATHLGVDGGRTVAAGDGSNDASLLMSAPHAIAVGNATPALRRALGRNGAYQAETAHAGGILEGLRAIGALPGDGS
ncbi:MAG TPA: HAD family hydrolase [Acidimicrobiia bacterium]